jgi:DNA replication protein DnaC
MISMKNRYPIQLGLDRNRVDEEAYDKLYQIMTNIEEVIANGTNLYIYSIITGNGKTSWALKLAQAYLNKTWYKNDRSCTVLFINVPSYLLAIKDNITTKSEYVSHIKENVLDADLVIWDDIATKAATSFEHENLLSIIDSRIANSKSNIYTSNLNPDELHQFMGDRLFSRIYHKSLVFEFRGNDKRGI